MSEQPKSRLRLHILMAAIAIAFLVMIWRFLVPVLLGAVVAAAANPLCQRLRRLTRLGAAPASALTTVLLAAGVVLPVVALLVAGIRSVVTLVGALRDRLTPGQPGLAESLWGHPAVAKAMSTLDRLTPYSESQLRESLTSGLQQVGLKVGAVLGDVLQQLPQAVLFLFVMVVALYFFLVDGARLTAWLVRQSPFDAERTQFILGRVREMSVGTLVSSLVVGAVQALILFLGMLASGVPNAPVWGAAAFMSSFLPIVGAAPVSLGCVIYLFAAGHTGRALVMLVAAAVASTSDNVVRPLVLGGGRRERSIAQHPLVLLLSIFGGLKLVGPAGVFIGPVLASLFFSVLQLYTEETAPRAAPPANP